MKKNIAVFSRDEAIKSCLEQIEEISAVLLHQDVTKDLQTDAILMMEHCVELSQLKDVRQMYPNIPLFYKLEYTYSSSALKNILTVCTSHDVHLISERYDHQQTANEINKILFNQDMLLNARLVGFFGTHSSCGVSTVTLNTARMLAQQVKEKVLVLSLNPHDPSDYFLKYRGHYLDELKIELKNQLSEDSLKNAVHYYENEGFYHLAGNRDIKMQRYYQTNEINNLLNTALNVFDVVLVDAGSHFDNACYPQTFVRADLKFLVTTQETKGYRSNWPLVYHQLIKPFGTSTDEYLLLLNRYRKDAALISEKELQEEMEMPLLATIPDEDVFGNIAVTQKELLVDIAEDHYKAAINIIAQSIIKRLQLRVEEHVEIKQSWLSRLFHKSA